MYPKLSAFKRIKNIDRNLLPALRTILIQVNSGIPLFNVLVGISSEDYGEISVEFKKVVKEINTGTPEVEALEVVSSQNPSVYFRRAVWQLVNGIKSGASVEIVIREVINALSQEQLIEIENYGSTLNPLAMFYMLVAIILPALGMTLMIVVASFMNISEAGVKMMFWGLYSIVVFAQIMFLGLIRSKRPNLLGV
ncbi:MAG: type II secretion system F family protein [Candidatus Woesearchaeota archaeon]